MWHEALSIFGSIFLIISIFIYILGVLYFFTKFVFERIVCRKIDRCKKGSCPFHEDCHRSGMTDAQREELEFLLKELEVQEKIQKLKMQDKE